jgi:hypothetical protein
MINCCANAYWCKNFHVKVFKLFTISIKNIPGFRVFMPAINYTAPTQTFIPQPHHTNQTLFDIVTCRQGRSLLAGAAGALWRYSLLPRF